MNHPLKVICLTVVAISVLVFNGCASTDVAPGTQHPSDFTIVTSFYPMYITTLNIAKDIPGVSVVNMTEPQTGCLHDYQLTARDMKTLFKANAFVINGAGMEAFMSKVTEQAPNLKVIDASQGIPLVKNTTDGELNPHVWVSISDAIQQTENIGAQLALADPAHKASYRSNTTAYVKKLLAEKAKMHKALDSLKNRDIITFHEAFPYFAQEFNLKVVAVIEREPGSEPSAGELAQTIRVIRQNQTKALFAEPQYSPRAAEMISKETGARIYSLDPVSGGQDTATPDDYLRIMDTNLKALKEALTQP